MIEPPKLLIKRIQIEQCLSWVLVIPISSIDNRNILCSTSSGTRRTSYRMAKHNSARICLEDADRIFKRLPFTHGRDGLRVLNFDSLPSQTLNGGCKRGESTTGRFKEKQ